MATREQRLAKQVERLERERDLLRQEVARQLSMREETRRRAQHLEERCEFLYHEAVALGGALVEARVANGSMSKERVDRFGIPTINNAAQRERIYDDATELLELIAQEAKVT